DDGANEMLQKSVDPGPTRSSMTSSGPAASNSSAIPAIAAIGRYRSRYDSRVSRASSGLFAPRFQPGQSRLNATDFFPLGPRSMTVRTGMAGVWIRWRPHRESNPALAAEQAGILPLNDVGAP